MALRILGHGVVVAILTALSQLGGLAWLGALVLGRRWLTFPLLYGGLWIVAAVAAPLFGRVPLPCVGEPLRMHSGLYCVLMRHYVDPRLAQAAEDAAAAVARAHPGTVTLALDGNFPFWDGFPLLPHLSHDDGTALDFAFYYTDADGTYLPGRTRSPLGYFAFEAVPPERCAPGGLRWDLRPLQRLWPDRPLEPRRTRTLIAALLQDPRVGRAFVEPPLAARLDLAHPRLRFQGCRAARHDDHVHISL